MRHDRKPLVWRNLIDATWCVTLGDPADCDDLVWIAEGIGSWERAMQIALEAVRDA